MSKQKKRKSRNENDSHCNNFNDNHSHCQQLEGYLNLLKRWYGLLANKKESQEWVSELTQAFEANVALTTLLKREFIFVTFDGFTWCIPVDFCWDCADFVKLSKRDGTWRIADSGIGITPLNHLAVARLNRYEALTAKSEATKGGVK